ncbi:uncharacterized protein CDAR_42731 [Caerostris darwini]|uniref:Uncharacterized protein n=1 Tax=Caerostris darwini TaxID=1538125 RepID=A0AAV4WF60_9ARAC|nr:uncharacterized protein CDAR_42731 [Caerostris darwini]
MSNRNQDINYSEKIDSTVFDHKCKIEWRIRKFSKCYRNLYTTEITPYYKCRTKWKMFINFLRDDIDVGFERCDGADDCVQGQFRICLQNTRGKIYDLASSSSSGKLLRILRPSANEHKGFKLLEDDVLVIKGSITLSGCCVLTTSSATYS